MKIPLVCFLVVFGLASLFCGVMVGERFGRLNWQEGYRVGYSQCEVDFLVEQGAVLECRQGQ